MLKKGNNAELSWVCLVASLFNKVRLIKIDHMTSSYLPITEVCIPAEKLSLEVVLSMVTVVAIVAVFSVSIAVIVGAAAAAKACV